MSETEVTTEVQFVNTDDLDAFSDGFFGQNTSEPSPTKLDSDTVAVAEQDEPTTEVEEVTADTKDPELEAEYVEPPPKKQTVQDRINELVKQREDVKRDAEARLEAQKREFEARLAALEQSKPAETVKAAASEPTPNDRTETGEDKYPLGEFDPQYIRDLTRFTLEQERVQLSQKAEAQARERQLQEQRSSLQQNWSTKLETARQEYPDFIEKSQALINRFTNLEPQYSQYLTDTFMEMDHGPEVLYYLSSNPDEAIKIINSGAKKATIALGRIEARFADVANQKLAARPKVTKAPPPPVARARGTNGAFVSVAPDTEDLSAFEQEFFRR